MINRKKLSSGRSKRLFSNTAGNRNINRKNALLSPMRGGYRA